MSNRKKKRIYDMADSKITTTKESGKDKKSNAKHIIIGIAVLLLVLSNAWASAVILMGTSGLVNRILVSPMLIFVAFTLLYAFIKAFNNNK